MGDEIISTIPARENDEFIKSSVDDLVPIPKESEVTSVCDYLECDMSITTHVPTTVVTEENFDINSPLGEYVVKFLIENKDAAGLPRHLVKYLFNHLLKSLSLTKGMSDAFRNDEGDEDLFFRTSSYAITPSCCILIGREIPSGEIKVHIEVLSVLWRNRLPIPDGSLPLSG
nr:hypothetical protein [Tanacetum cinerariifolium]